MRYLSSFSHLFNIQVFFWDALVSQKNTFFNNFNFNKMRIKKAAGY